MNNQFNSGNYNSFYMQNTNITTVNGINDVMSRMQPFGSSYIYVDNNEPVIYKKSLGNNGEVDIQIYDIKLREPKNNNYVSREEFDKLLSKLERYEKLNKEVIENEPVDK